MILAPVTVRCPSNGRSASSTSGLLAPAAQTSAGHASCSYLPWPAAMRRRPHRPLLLPPLAQGIPLLSHTPCYSAVTAASHRSRTSERSYSSPRGHPLPRLAWLRIVPFLGPPSSTAVVLSAWRGQCGQRPTSIGRVLYVERLTAGSMAAAGSTTTAQFFCDLPSKLLCQAYWAANLSRRGELHSTGPENGLPVMRNGLYIFKTHQTGN
jgi:hypothetical protein